LIFIPKRVTKDFYEQIYRCNAISVSYQEMLKEDKNYKVPDNIDELKPNAGMVIILIVLLGAIIGLTTYQAMLTPQSPVITPVTLNIKDLVESIGTILFAFEGVGLITVLEKIKDSKRDLNDVAKKTDDDIKEEKKKEKKHVSMNLFLAILIPMIIYLFLFLSVPFAVPPFATLDFSGNIVIPGLDVAGNATNPIIWIIGLMMSPDLSGIFLIFGMMFVTLVLTGTISGSVNIANTLGNIPVKYFGAFKKSKQKNENTFKINSKRFEEGFFYGVILFSGVFAAVLLNANTNVMTILSFVGFFATGTIFFIFPLLVKVRSLIETKQEEKATILKIITIFTFLAFSGLHVTSLIIGITSDFSTMNITNIIIDTLFFIGWIILIILILASISSIKS
nr:hypothetical protein [Candidatus Sigynarchaeota archaeon]